MEYVLKSQFDQKTYSRAWGEVEQKRLFTTKLQRNLSHNKIFDFLLWLCFFKQIDEPQNQSSILVTLTCINNIRLKNTIGT